jgi:hypothetical protein
MYRHVAVFELEGDFLGYAIRDDKALKLQSTNLYSEDEGPELADRLRELNESQAVTAVWPDARDPEVQALVNDPEFEPIEYVEDDVVDEDNSFLVYLKDPDGEDTLDIDREASVLVYKKVRVPARPSDYFERTKKACEVVARRRAI